MFSNLRKQDFWPSRGTFFIGIGIAICLAALVSLLVQTTRILEAQKTEALVMDVAGYQRTLHQKHLTEMLLASQGIPSDYFATRKAIQSNLHALMHGGMVLINLRTGKTDQIPQAPTDTILAKLQEQEAFLREVVEISNQGLPPSTNQGLDSSPMFQTLLNHNDQLLRIADEAVKLFNRHFESKMTSMITLEWAMGIFVAFLVILLTSLWIRTYRKLNHEIIERQRAEADNQENKIFLTSIVENLPNMLFVKSALDLRFVMFNKAGEELLGYSRNDLIGKTDYDFFPKEEAESFTDKDKQVLSGKTLVDIPNEPILTKSKGLRHLHTQKIPILDEKGHPQFLLGISEDITEHIQGEENIRKSEERYRTLYEDNPSMYFTVAQDGEILSVNQFGAQQLGYTVNELIGQPVFNVFYPEDIPLLKRELASCLQNPQELFHWEFRKVKKTGEIIWVKEAVRAVLRQDEKIELLIACEDISVQKRAEELQHLQNTVLKRIVEGVALNEILDDLCRTVEKMAPGAICSVMLLDKEEKYLRIGAGPNLSPKLASVLDGLEPGKSSASCGTAVYLKKPVIVTDTMTDPHWENFREVAHTHEIGSCWSFPIFSEGKKAMGSFAICNSTSRSPEPFHLSLLENSAHLAGVALQRRQAESALLQSEAKAREQLAELNLVYQTAPIGICFIGRDLRFIRVNQTLADITRHSPEEHVGRTWEEISPELATKVTPIYQKVLETQNPVMNHEVHRVTSGKPETEEDWLVSHFPVVENEKILGVTTVFQDITQVKQAEARLNAVAKGVTSTIETQFFHSLVEYLAKTSDADYAFIGELTKDEPKQIRTLAVWAKDHIADNFEYPLPGTPCEHVVTQQRLFSFTHGLQALFLEDALLAELNVDAYVGTPLFDSSGSPFGLMAILTCQPLTNLPLAENALGIFAARATAELERRQNQEKLRESEDQRLEALRQSDALKSALLSSVSHELRTPLTAIKISVSSLMGLNPPTSAQHQDEFLGEIDLEIDYMSRLVDNLLDMSRIEAGTLVPKREWHPFEDLLEGALRRFDTALKTRTLDIDLPINLAPVFVDAVEIQQVLINLLDNAIKYSTANTTVRIKVTIKEQEIEIQISNEGEWIPTMELERIFERFYRLQWPHTPLTSGTGLGLAICKGIIEAHGGRIWAESLEGGGMKIIFTIPATESMAPFSLEVLHKG